MRDPEVVPGKFPCTRLLAEEEIKQTYEKLYGWVERGGDLKSEEAKNRMSSGDNRFSQHKLSKELNIARSKLSKDLQLANRVHPVDQRPTSE